MRNRFIFSIKQIAQFGGLPASGSEFNFKLGIIWADAGVWPITKIVVNVQEVDLKEIGFHTFAIFLRLRLIIQGIIEEILEFRQVDFFDVVFSIAVIGLLMFAKEVLSKGFVIGDKVDIVLGEAFVSILLKDWRLGKLVLFPLTFDKTSRFIKSFVRGIIL